MHLNSTLYPEMLYHEGIPVIKLCADTNYQTGSVCFSCKVLIFVIKGKLILNTAKKDYTVSENQMVLIHRSVLLNYENGEQRQDYKSLEYISFTLHENLLNDFKKALRVRIRVPRTFHPLTIENINEKLFSFFTRIKNSFKEQGAIHTRMVKSRLFELLIFLSYVDGNILQQLFTF